MSFKQANIRESITDDGGLGAVWIIALDSITAINSDFILQNF